MGMPEIKSSNTKLIQSLTDILESIALEEAAIAHIINAEGEKIQKVVGDCKVSVDELLATNKSVEMMIDKLISLEIVLKEKAEIVAKLILECNMCHKHSECKD